MKSNFFSVEKKNSDDFKNSFGDSLYHIFLFNGNGKIIIDFTEYTFNGRTVFFSSPFQNIQILSSTRIDVEVLNFHGDFYCIEFHKKEVACQTAAGHWFLQPEIDSENNLQAELYLTRVARCGCDAPGVRGRG